jgi:hypothetical protein
MKPAASFTDRRTTIMHRFNRNMNKYYILINLYFIDYLWQGIFIYILLIILLIIFVFFLNILSDFIFFLLFFVIYF